MAIKADLVNFKKVEPYDPTVEAKNSDEEVLQKIDEVAIEVVENGMPAKEADYYFLN